MVEAEVEIDDFIDNLSKRQKAQLIEALTGDAAWDEDEDGTPLVFRMENPDSGSNRRPADFARAAAFDLNGMPEVPQSVNDLLWHVHGQAVA